MKSFRLLFLSFIGLAIGVFFLTALIEGRVTAYKHVKEDIAEQLSFKERLASISGWIPFTGEGDEAVETWLTLEKKATAKYKAGLAYAAILVALVFLFVALNVLAYRNTTKKYQAFGMVMIFSALSFLYLGLKLPLIEIMAYNKDLTFDLSIYSHTFDGRVYYLYQNKSILQLIGILYTGGNFLVAIILMVVSVVFPLVKLIVSLVILMGPEKEKNKKRYIFIRNLGKWSMADVLIAAIFLAFFAYSNMEVGVDLGSETLIGTYFYLIFVALSINSGQYLKKAMKQNQEVKPLELD